MSDETTNEIVAAARDAKAATSRSKKDGGKHDGGKQWPIKAIGLGVGIGSAAVAAAILYVNRDKDD